MAILKFQYIAIRIGCFRNTPPNARRCELKDVPAGRLNLNEAA